MRMKLIAALLITAAPVFSASGQGVAYVPVGGTGGKPVPQDPPADPDDSPEEIAKDAARDLKDSRFYNKPGATRAQYDSDWQECRLIARGSRTPAGTVPYYYNPAVISPVAAGVGGALGGMIASAIIEGQQRRANRRSCLLIKGWRLVELPDAETKRIAAMSDEERSAFFDTVVGASEVKGEITERISFAQPADEAIRANAKIATLGSLFVGKKIDPSAPIKLEPGEGAIVLAYRRPDEESAGRHGTLQFTRYDTEKRDAVYRPKDWKKKGDKTTYFVTSTSGDKTAPLEVQVIRMTPGDYVISSASIGKIAGTSSYCFGAPTFQVKEGEVAYLGDFIPYSNLPLSDGKKFAGLAYASHADEARRALADKQPELAAAMKPVELRNRATFACAAINMDRWDLPGFETLPELSKIPADETGGSPATAAD